MSTTVSADMVSYCSQVFTFCQSLAIKYQPMVDAMNTVVVSRGGSVDVSQPLTWKYYLNLKGEYHPTDTVMRCVSFDTLEEIVFDTATLANHPATRHAYRIGTREHAALIARYPDNVEVVRGILCPVDPVAALAAQDLTLLGYGSGYLDEVEEDYIVAHVREFLAYVDDRWYFPFLQYEVYYPWVFWGQLFVLIAMRIFTARIEAIRTAYAHPWHMWEYLVSAGLGDYRDILEPRQARFLYRNIDYLLANRGKNDNIVVLVNNLLPELNVGLVAKTIRMRTDVAADDYRWKPEFVSELIPTKYSNSVLNRPSENVEQITRRLYAAHVETSTAPDYVDGIYDRLARTSYNTLPTKLLEILPLSIDRKYAPYLQRMMLDMTFIMIATGRYTPKIVWSDEVSGTLVTLEGKTLLAWLSYCIFRSCGTVPRFLPTHHQPAVFVSFDAASASYPPTISFRGHTYRTDALFNVDTFVSGFAYPPSTILEPLEFSDTVARLFTAVVRNIIMSRSENDSVRSYAMVQVSEMIMSTKAVDLSLAGSHLYSDWFLQEGKALAPFASLYDSRPEALTLYRAAVGKILSLIVPVTKDLKRFLYLATDDEFYRRLKELFVQLCSYTVEYLDTSRQAPDWAFFAKWGVYMDAAHAYESALLVNRDLRMTTCDVVRHDDALSGDMVHMAPYDRLESHPDALPLNHQTTPYDHITSDNRLYDTQAFIATERVTDHTTLVMGVSVHDDDE